MRDRVPPGKTQRSGMSLLYVMAIVLVFSIVALGIQALLTQYKKNLRVGELKSRRDEIARMLNDTLLNSVASLSYTIAKCDTTPTDYPNFPQNPIFCLCFKEKQCLASPATPGTAPDGFPLQLYRNEPTSISPAIAGGMVSYCPATAVGTGACEELAKKAQYLDSKTCPDAIALADDHACVSTSATTGIPQGYKDHKIQAVAYVQNPTAPANNTAEGRTKNLFNRILTETTTDVSNDSNSMIILPQAMARYNVKGERCKQGSGTESESNPDYIKRCPFTADVRFKVGCPAGASRCVYTKDLQASIQFCYTVRYDSQPRGPELAAQSNISGGQCTTLARIIQNAAQIQTQGSSSSGSSLSTGLSSSQHSNDMPPQSESSESMSSESSLSTFAFSSAFSSSSSMQSRGSSSSASEEPPGPNPGSLHPPIEEGATLNFWPQGFRINQVWVARTTATDTTSAVFDIFVATDTGLLYSNGSNPGSRNGRQFEVRHFNTRFTDVFMSLDRTNLYLLQGDGQRKQSTDKGLNLNSPSDTGPVLCPAPAAIEGAAYRFRYWSGMDCPFPLGSYNHVVSNGNTITKTSAGATYQYVERLSTQIGVSMPFQLPSVRSIDRVLAQGNNVYAMVYPYGAGPYWFVSTGGGTNFSWSNHTFGGSNDLISGTFGSGGLYVVANSGANSTLNIFSGEYPTGTLSKKNVFPTGGANRYGNISMIGTNLYVMSYVDTTQGGCIWKSTDGALSFQPDPRCFDKDFATVRLIPSDQRFYTQIKWDDMNIWGEYTSTTDVWGRDFYSTDLIKGDVNDVVTSGNITAMATQAKGSESGGVFVRNSQGNPFTKYTDIDAKYVAVAGDLVFFVTKGNQVMGKKADGSSVGPLITSGLDADQINGLFGAGGRLYVTTSNNGVFIFNVNDLNARPTLAAPGSHVTVVYVPVNRSTLYVGTTGGLLIYGGYGATRLNTFTTSTGLPCNKITGVAASDTTLFVATECGIAKGQ